MITKDEASALVQHSIGTTLLAEFEKLVDGAIREAANAGKESIPVKPLLDALNPAEQKEMIRRLQKAGFQVTNYGRSDIITWAI